MNKKNLTLLSTLTIVLFTACNMNDYKAEYQKDMVYDGLHTAVDSVMIKTYYAIDSVPQGSALYSEVTKLYDINGYVSMIKSKVHLQNGTRQTTEMISRDKNSLPIARDIIIEIPNTETAVTLARLKKRKNGVEEWLYRYYLDAEKYIEDANMMIYTSFDKTTKKRIGDSLQIVEIENYNQQGRIIYRQPTLPGNDHPHVHTYYNNEGLVDSLVAKYYQDNNVTASITNEYTERHKYELDGYNNPIRKYIYRSDSLLFISESVYSYRK